MALLLTPGPVKLTDDIRLAQSQEMITHRGKDFQSLYAPLVADCKALMDCAEAHLMTGSGTLGIEANVSNALPAGGKALCLSNGAFGDKLNEHCQLYYPGSKFVRLNDAKGWDLERAKPHIDEAAATGCKLFAMVHHETSPGILNKVKEICQYAKGKGMLTLLDGTSAWPAHEFSQKEFSCDFYSWASQKAIGAPPGIVCIGLSEDAIKAVEAAPVRSNFMNLKTYRKNMAKNETPTTPAISILYALRVAVDRVKKEGGVKGWAERHRKTAERARQGITTMGYKLVTEPGFESNAITAFFTEKNKEINSLMQSKYGVKLGGGHADWKDTTLRFCTLGNVTIEECEKGLAALEDAKKELGA